MKITHLFKCTKDGRLFIRSSKNLFFNRQENIHIECLKIQLNESSFNRIAKTGSQAFIALLYQLEGLNNFKVNLDMMQTEYLIEPPELVEKLVKKTQQV
jgi:hypothetical protein